MDLQATMNEPVYSAHEGVCSIYWGNASGNYIIVSHNSTDPDDDISSIYAHLDNTLISDGFVITESNLDTQIGESGNSGSDYSHLHFGIADDHNWFSTETTKIHPLQKLPYTYNCDEEAYLTFEEGFTTSNFTLRLHVEADQLNVYGIVLRIHWTEFGEGFFQYYSLNYESCRNIPRSHAEGNEGIGIVEQLISNNQNSNWEDRHWAMTVSADSFNGIDPQNIMYNIYEQDENDSLEIYSLYYKIYKAPGIYGNLVPLSLPPTDTENNVIPQITDLYQNYPNPFNPETTIAYQIHEPDHDYKLGIYNTKGQRVMAYNLEDKIGIGSVIWNGRNFYDNPVSSGIYLYRIESDSRVMETKKMTLVK